MNNIVKLFKALGDETRLKILFLLARKNVCAKGISRHLGISEAAVSQHIKVLKDSGIILGHKKSYFIHYSVNNEILDDLIHFTDSLKDPEVVILNDLNFLDFKCERKENCSKRCNKSNCERRN